MSDIELIRELRGLEGDKALIKHAVSSKQEEMSLIFKLLRDSFMESLFCCEKIFK